MSNPSVPIGTAGLQITARNVMLDRNGFTIPSQGSCGQDTHSMHTRSMAFRTVSAKSWTGWQS